MDKKRLFITILTILLTSALCLGLYQADNKYTKSDVQPINGVLFFSEEANLSYLTRQWVLYPDVLLSPEEVNDYSGYRCYTDISNQSGHSSNSMTYQLTLLLPEAMTEYALELPEIFSACKLYINNRLLLQLGNPAPENYEEGLSSRIVTFSAAGKTTILLAVSDYSGVNQGLTYPPAFGLADTVLAAREGRLLLHGVFTLLALLGALLAISFGKNILTCFLCLCLSVITAYPLYHGLFITEVQPWYTLEPVCYYALLLSALLLQCHVYELKFKHRIYLMTPGIIGLLATLIRFSCAAILPEFTASIFSSLATILKYYTAICLLGLSLWALWKKKTHSLLLLCGSAALATCLIWDRLLPLYEPIYGGWFGEIGGALLVIFLGAAAWIDAVNAYQFRLTYETSLQQMQQRLAMQKEHYTQLTKQVRLAREAGHDLHHHMRIMRGLAEQEEWHYLQDYLNEYESHIQERDVRTWSQHLAADAVLRHYASAAKELNAEYDVRLTISPSLAIPDDELCILLSNLLENAVEAVSHQKLDKRKIYLRGEVIDNRLGIVVDNTYHKEPRQKDGVYLSSKHSGHGLGISSIITIVEKYNGLADFEGKDGVFHASILIPLTMETRI